MNTYSSLAAINPDIFAYKDGESYAIQCKRSASKIGNKAIQEVYSGKDYYKKDIGVVITNNDFTAQAISTAKNLNVLLWRGSEIEKLLQTMNR